MSTSAQEPQGQGPGTGTGVALGSLAAVPPLGAEGLGLVALEKTGVLGTQAIANIVDEVLDALREHSRGRLGRQADELRSTLESAFPERTADELDPLVLHELKRERAFQRKMEQRIRRDLPAALQEDDPDKRRERVQKLMLREQRYVGMRVQAMHDRALARGEHLAVKEASPAGAYWWLNPDVRHHTPGCLMLGHKFWPWPLLEEMSPPVHAGCRCELLTLGEAVDRGYMHESQVPDEDEAVRRGREMFERARKLDETVAPDELRAWVQALVEAEALRDQDRTLSSLAEARWARRFGKGVDKGGEFMPKVGASAHELLKAFLPHYPQTPAERLRKGHGRWHRLGGRNVFVPEARSFDRTLGGHRYVSTPGTTDVHRVTPTSALAVEHPFGRRNESVVEKLDPIRSQAANAAASRILQALHDHSQPVFTGALAGPTDDGLRQAGFTHTAASGRELAYVAPDGTSELRLRFSPDYRTVESVVWKPHHVKDPAKPLSRPVRNWHEFTRELDSEARSMALQHGRRAFLKSIVSDDGYVDHGAETMQDGVMHLGQEFRPSVEALAAARAAGRKPTENELRNAYAATQAGMHEAIHASTPFDVDIYSSPAAASLEEALTEELSHLEAARVLQRRGERDVLRWRANNPLDPKAVGSYRPARAALSRALNHAGIPAEQREGVLRRLLLDTAPADRLPALNDLAKGAGVIGELARPADAPDFVPILAPALEPDTGDLPAAFRGPGVALQTGDRLQVGDRPGTLLATREVLGRTLAHVRFDDGEVNYAVPATTIKHGTPSRQRLAGSAAAETDGISEGDRVRWADGQATVRRILRPGPDWALDATTDDGKALILTPSRAPHLQTVGAGTRQQRQGGPPTRPPTLDELAATGRLAGEGSRRAPRTPTSTGRRNEAVTSPENAPQLGPITAEGDAAQLQRKWATLDRELLPYAGRPNEPGARKIIDEQKAVVKLIHHHNLDEGGHAGIGKPGGAHDVVVVGAGPAGLSAAIYGATEGLDTLLVDAEPKAGGQARMSSRIENVLGFPAGITGRQLAEMSLDQAERTGAEVKLGVSVKSLTYDPETGLKTLVLSNGETISSRAVVIAGGVQFRKMDFPGSDSPDVVYGDSTTLKERCEGKGVVIVGGANSAGQAAIDVATKASHVTLLIRKGNIRDKMSAYLVDQLESDPKVTILHAEIGSASEADGRMTGITLKDGRKVDAAALGLFIGSAPAADWSGVERDDHGFVKVGEKGDMLETSTPGVFAAGDVRTGSMHRVIAAASDGAVAISQVHGYMSRLAGAHQVVEGAVEDAAAIDNDEADDFMDRMDELDQGQPFTGLEESLMGRFLPALHPRSRLGEFIISGRRNQPTLPGMGDEGPELEPLDLKKLPKATPIHVMLPTFDDPVVVMKGGKSGKLRFASTGQEVPAELVAAAKVVKKPTSTSAPHASSPVEPAGPVAVDPQRLYGGEHVVDADSTEWVVGKVSVKKSKGRETVTKAKLYTAYGEYREIEKDAEALKAGYTIDAGSTKKTTGWSGGTKFKPKPLPPKEDDDGLMTLGQPAGGTQGARFAEGKDGDKYVVKTYQGNQDRVATELLGNAIYRKLGIAVPEATVAMFDKKPAVASRVVEGKTDQWKGENAALGEGFMADALLANWDVVGLTQDNVLWDDGEPIRVDQGGTLEFRAQGSSKPFGPVPSEVWTMSGPKGQAYGRMLLTPEVKHEGAAQIAAVLTPEAIDELVNVAPFKDMAMKERVRENLKARVDWMRRYSTGEVGEPQPATGDEAHQLLDDDQGRLKFLPEETAALERTVDHGLGDVNEHLRSGAPKQDASKEITATIKGLDSAIGYAKLPSDVYGWLAVPRPPREGSKLADKGYLVASLDADEAHQAAGETGGVLKLLIPAGKGAVYLPKHGSSKRWLLLKRGMTARVVRADGTDGDAVLL